MKIVITLLFFLACKSLSFDFGKKASSFLENKLALKFSSKKTSDQKGQNNPNFLFRSVKCSMISEDNIVESNNNLRLDEDGIFILKQDSEEIKINYSE